MKRLLLLSSLVFQLPNALLYGQAVAKEVVELKPQAIEEVVQKHLAKNFNGGVLVIRQGIVLYQKTHGFSNYDTKTMLNDSSIFDLASVSNQFTALGIMVLHDKGKLKFTDKLTKFFPQLPYKDVTVHHLLTHTAGLKDYIELLEEHWDTKKIAHNKDIIDLLAKHKPQAHFKAGEQFEFSNTGYALLASIIEKVSGMSYNEFMKKSIFDKIGMKHSRIYNTRRGAKPEIIPNYAYGFVYDPQLKKFVLPDSLFERDYVIWLDGVVGDGTVSSTLPDLTTWTAAMLEHKLVKQKTLDLAYTNQTTNKGEKIGYGYGVKVSDSNYGKLISHIGTWDGYSASMSRYLDKDLTIFILSNNDYLDSGMEEFAKELSDAVLK